MSSDGQLENRVAKCTGCGTSISELDGEFLVSSARERSSVPQAHTRKPPLLLKMKTNKSQTWSRIWLNLEEEQQRAKQKQIALLQQQIEDKQIKLGAGDLPEHAGPS